MKFEKREYQEDIVKKVVQNNKHTLIHLPTGGGKTYIATEIIKELSSDIFTNFNQILFITPKIILMEQTIEAFDKGLRDLYSKKRWLKPKKIHASNNDIDSKVLVSTIHTASRRKILKPDIIIIDEIHYGFNGQMYKKLIENNPNARIIGLSATPYDQYGKKLKGFTYIDDYDIKYLMSNDFLVHKLRQYELIKQDLSKIRIIAGDYDKGQLSKFVCDNKKILEIVESTKDFIDNSKKTIVFAVDIEHSELLTQAYVNAGFKAKALHSKLNKDNDNEPIEISEEIENFRIGKTKVLVSVLMLTTGFDVPDTDCAIIARPTRSQNLYKQMVGRILRKSDAKEEAILLDCGNVIENLGMPLDPIREVKDAQYNTTVKCKQCKSKNYKLTKKDNGLCWLCLDCGYFKKANSGSYKCLRCSEVHDYNSDFRIEENKLKLICKCGYKTIISEYTNEKFIEITENKEAIEIKRYIGIYIKILIDEFGQGILDRKIVKNNVNNFKIMCENKIDFFLDLYKSLSNSEIRNNILEKVKSDNKELYENEEKLVELRNLLKNAEDKSLNKIEIHIKVLLNISDKEKVLKLKKQLKKSFIKLYKKYESIITKQKSKLYYDDIGIDIKTINDVIDSELAKYTIVNNNEKNNENHTRKEIENLLNESTSKCFNKIQKYIDDNLYNNEKLLKLRQEISSKIIDLKIKYLGRKKVKKINKILYFEVERNLNTINEYFNMSLSNIINDF